ncbi:MAG: competence/damage-inducible protein A [Actinomycetota bacterium]
MRCDVVAIGTELLLGQIIDTNSSYIGEQLALNGIDSLLQVKVGDNLGRMETVLRRVLADADAVVICGGLGPTHDDVTREAIAAIMGAELVEDEGVVAVITQLFAARGRYMAPNNLRQALVPVGASIIPQTRGTAPGLICPVVVDGVEKVMYAVPGVPHEMKDMLERAVLPDLRSRAGEASAIVSRTLRTWGESESALNERLEPVIEQLEAVGNPTLAFLASGWEGIKVRLTAKAPTAAAAEALLEPVEAHVRAIVGQQVFGVDDDTMESVVLQLLRERGLTLGLAESVTGGLVGGRITAVPGASSVFRGGIISYASEVKFDLLGVPEGPVVNEPTAAAMAEGACRVLGADVGLALTGVGGPAEQDGMPVGTLCVGVSMPDGAGGRSTITRTFRLPGQRDQMRQMSVITALDLLRRTLLDLPAQQ